MEENSPQYLPRWKTVALFGVAQVGALLIYLLFQQQTIPIRYFLLASFIGWASLFAILALRDKGKIKIDMPPKMVVALMVLTMLYSVTSLGWTALFGGERPISTALSYIFAVGAIWVFRKHRFWSP